MTACSLTRKGKHPSLELGVAIPGSDAPRNGGTGKSEKL